MQVLNWHEHTMVSSLSQFIISILLHMICFTTKTMTADHESVSLNMPGVRPAHDETYLCTAQRQDLSENKFIVGFEPNASASRVHHILIYGCSQPGIFVRDTPNYVWDCGEMSIDSDETLPSPYETGPVCADGAERTILFGWALDAPSVETPPRVGFKIGGDSDIKYLVLQVHYGSIKGFMDDPDTTDDSGIVLHTVWGENHGITRMAGIYLLLSNGYVPMGISRHTMECMIQEDKIIHPFRFRTHTHKLGVNVAGYKKPVEDPMNLVLIGQHDPQKPQMFYPVEDNSLTITRGDRVFAYCDYNNTRDHTVYIGATGNDEMCNFYMMYWTEGDELLKQKNCLHYNPH